MNDEHEFDRTRRESPFEALNAADRQLGASPEVEARLLSEVRSLSRAPRGYSFTMLAAAAGLVIAVGASVWFARGADPGPVTEQARATEEVEAEAEAVDAITGFVPLGYNRNPSGPTHIVRLEVSRQALASLGLLPLDEGSTSGSETLLADVIIGDDGLARAVRFVGPAPEQE